MTVEELSAFLEQMSNLPCVMHQIKEVQVRKVLYFVFRNLRREHPMGCVGATWGGGGAGFDLTSGFSSLLGCVGEGESFPS